MDAKRPSSYPSELDSLAELELSEISDLDLSLGPESPLYNATTNVSLIVEPDQHIQRLMHTWLIDLQVGHTQLADGEQAISACAAYKYSIIFIDLDHEWHSSVQTGYDATRNIRFAEDGLNKLTPVIGLTRDHSCTVRAQACGVSDVLLKPFSKEHVATVVKKWAGGVVDLMDLSSAMPTDLLPPLDISQLAPPDFMISGLVRPKTARVLVVEDCALTQRVITSLLSSMTSNYSQAFDGEQAVQMCQTAQFDLILMDMTMPKLNGIEATRHIRSNSKNMSTPIVAFTSSGTLEDYSAYGVDDMLPKPFTTETLSNIFDKWTAYVKQLDAVADHTSYFVGGVSNGNRPSHSSSSAVQALSSDMSFSQKTTSGGSHELQAHSPLVSDPRPNDTTSPTASQPRDLKPRNQNLNIYQPLGLGLPMPGLPSWNHGCGKTGSGGKRKKGQPRVTHNLKEQQRRKQISQAAEELSKIVPNLPAADKATVYQKTVEYVKLLRASITPNQLREIDDSFLRQKPTTTHGHDVGSTSGSESSAASSPAMAVG
eukprot:m.1011838 g.1011838  ORF g.1011838 m.1011838 type:complete len:541 (-) comp24063_c1_seq5:1869-3491(-)